MPALERMAGELLLPKLAEGDLQSRMSQIHSALAAAVEGAIRAGRRPICISGDCCSTIGVTAGLQRAERDPFLIWFDAHGDFNTWETTPSGFLGGMPLAMLVGRGEQRLLEAVGARPLAESEVILTDGRDLDSGEREALERSRIQHVLRVEHLLPRIPEQRPLYVHFDTDVLDPADAPAMNYPAPGGPRVGQLERVFKSLASMGNIAAISLSSWNPALDHDGQTPEMCLRLLSALTGA